MGVSRLLSPAHNLSGPLSLITHPCSLFFGTRMTREEFSAKLARRNQKGAVIPSEVNGPNELAPTPTSKMNGKALKEKVN